MQCCFEPPSGSPEALQMLLLSFWLFTQDHLLIFLCMLDFLPLFPLPRWLVFVSASYIIRCIQWTWIHLCSGQGCVLIGIPCLCFIPLVFQWSLFFMLTVDVCSRSRQLLKCQCICCPWVDFTWLFFPSIFFQYRVTLDCKKRIQMEPSNIFSVLKPVQCFLTD